MLAGLHSYHVSVKINGRSYPFYSLIMAAMRQADTPNAAKLAMVFPDIWEELNRRHNARLGVLPEDEVTPEALLLLPVRIDELMKQT